MPIRPSSAEEEYFAREEIEKLYKLARQQDAKKQAAEREALKKSHWMKCPKCGNDLHTVHLPGVEVDHCFHCNGTWLDQGEMDKIARLGQHAGDLDKMVQALKPPKR